MMPNLESMYKVLFIGGIAAALVMLGLYLYAGMRFEGWIWSIPLFGPTALFLLVIVIALIYSHILVKREENDSDSIE